MRRFPLLIVVTMASSFAACGDGDSLGDLGKEPDASGTESPLEPAAEDASLPDASLPDAEPALPAHPRAGQLVISEIQAAPVSYVDDSLAEWIELYNPSADATYDLSGCIFSDKPADDDHVIGKGVLIAPRGYLTLGSAQFSLEKNGFVADEVYGTSGTGLSGSGDAPTIKCDDIIIDSVNYGAAGFPVPEDDQGRTLQLDPAQLDAAQNDSASSWCFSRDSVFVTRPENEGSATMVSNHGTPKAANKPCP